MRSRQTSIVEFLVAGLLWLSGCGQVRLFPAVPEGIDRDRLPQVTVEMMAERYQFVPDEIRVKAGALVILHITARDATHGFNLPAFDIDESLEKGQTKTIEFYAAEKGAYDFKCSHYCGVGFSSMTGVVVVE